MGKVKILTIHYGKINHFYQIHIIICSPGTHTDTERYDREHIFY